MAGDDGSEGDTPGGIGTRLRSGAMRQLAVVGLVSLALRTWTLIQMRASNPLFAAPVLDDAVYVEAAQRFVDGAPAEAWFLAPLYPWLLGIVATVTGTEQVEMVLASGVSLACGVLTSIVLAATARRIAGSTAGWITGLVHALAAPFVFQDLIPSQEPVLSLLFAAAMALALEWHRSRSWWSVAAYGVVVGLAALGRGTSILLLPAALPLVLGAAHSGVPQALRTRKRAFAAAALAVVGTLVVLVPAAGRNASVTGDVTPFTWSFGPNLYAANCPQARDSGTYHSGDLGSTPAQMEERARRIAERHEGRELRPGEISAYWSTRTREELSIGPGLAGHVGTKVLLLFADHPFGTSHSLVAESRFASWLRFAPGGEWWLLALAAGSWWLVRRREPLADVPALAFALTAVALLILYPAGRYRLAVLTCSLVLVGPGLAWLRDTEARTRTIAGAIGVGVAVLAFVPHATGRFPLMYTDSRANVGTMLLENGRAHDAVEVLQEAEREEPGSTVVLASLAAAFDAVGRPGEAAAAAARHNEIIETLPAGRVRAVLDLAEQSRGDPAQLERAEALGQELAPRLLNDDLRAHLWANMAMVSALRGDRQEAAARLARAREHDPDLRHIREVESRMPR
jgi:4-amino-4-deoxy-L-arabinose transferase-like glycosyltransferase